MIGARVGIYSGKGIPFEGVLDNLNLSYYGYSFRRLTVDFLITSPIVRLRRSSDNAEMDFSYSADTNALDTNSLETGGATNIVTWMGSDTIYVVKVYEQTGTGLHATQTTAAEQPIFDKTGFYWNGYRYIGVQKALNIAISIPTIGIYSVNAVSNLVNSNVTLYDGLIKSLTPEPITYTGRMVYRNPYLLEFSANFGGAGKYAWKCFYDGTTESVTINGITKTRTATKTGGLAGLVWGLSEATYTNDCPKYELIINPNQYNATDANFIEAEQITYYGL